MLAALGMAGLPAVEALAQPQGGTVAAGSATISQTPGATTIKQNSDRAILNWGSFDVGAGEGVHFDQPGSHAIALNRIAAGKRSETNGTLTATGQVWLVNPSGVLFGPSSRVDVHGIVATTANISNDKFMGGAFDFSQASADPDAAIVNQGTINVRQDGYAVLAGQRVSNDGMIVGRLSSVILAGTPKFALDFDGDGLIRFVPKGGGQTVVENGGAINADGGYVLFTGSGVDAVMADVINTSGIIEANDTVERDGRVVLNGGGGRVVIDGTGSAGITAGDIEIDGHRVIVRQRVEAQDGVRIDAKYIASEDDGIIRGDRLELVSRTPANHLTGGTVSLAIDVDELAVGVAGADKSLFGQLELRNAGDLTVTTVGASSGISSRHLDLTVNGTLTLDQPMLVTADGRAGVVQANQVVNRAGANALQSPAGDFVVYLQDSTSGQLGGAPGTSIYGATIATLPPDQVAIAGDVFVYQNVPPAPPLPEPPAPPAPPAAPPPQVTQPEVPPEVTQPTVVPSLAGFSAEILNSQPLVQVVPVASDSASTDLFFANDGNRELWGLTN